TLRDDELVSLDAFLDDVPRSVRAVADSADAEAVALAERVEREALVRAELDAAIEAADRPRLRRDVAAEKVCKGTLADEADAGAVSLLGDRQARRAGKGAHLALRQIAQREHHALELARIDGVQEVALILTDVPALQQPGAFSAAVDASVMTGRKPVPAQPLGIAPQHTELDLAITENVRVGRPAPAALGEKVRED